MKLRKIRFTILISSWLILAALLTWINHTVPHLTFMQFIGIVAATLVYLIGSTQLLKPVTRKEK